MCGQCSVARMGVGTMAGVGQEEGRRKPSYSAAPRRRILVGPYSGFLLFSGVAVVCGTSRPACALYKHNLMCAPFAADITFVVDEVEVYGPPSGGCQLGCTQGGLARAGSGGVSAWCGLAWGLLTVGSSLDVSA